MRRFFFNGNLAKGRFVTIQGPDARHIQHVLRMHRGQALELIDGSGLVFAGRIEDFLDGKVVVTVEQSRPAGDQACRLCLTLSLGYLKDDKMDIVLRQATELGITRWQPYFAARSIPKPAEARLAGRVARWEKISREAVKQCRRSIVPRIDMPVGFEQMLELSLLADMKILFWEQNRVPFCLDVDPQAMPQHIWIVLGPEGGLTPQEVQTACRSGFSAAGLGPRILRAETAALTACALIQHCVGDLGTRCNPSGLKKS
jgi:16S rRNA (uracil1498-N3)-methyltransferase